MDTAAFVSRLEQLNVHVRVEDGKLRIKAPKTVLTDVLQAEIKSRKSELIMFLEKSEGTTHSQGFPLQRVPREGPLPLSFAQQRLWFLDQLEPNSPVYLLSFPSRVKGPLDLAALEGSLRILVQRHESLRTTFQEEDGSPFQVISFSSTVELFVFDLRAQPAEKQETEIDRIIKQEAHQSFDLAVGPLYRFCIIKLSAEEHIFIATLHHIISDGLSMGILYRELSQAYEAISTGQDPALPQLPIQYVDYAVWERQRLQGPVFDSLLAYWKQHVGETPPVLELPTDYPTHSRKTYHTAGHRSTLPIELNDSARKLSQVYGVTNFTTMLTVFYILLFRLSRQENLVLGIDEANRTHPQVKGVIGFFVNILVLRVNLSGNPTCAELLQRTQRVILDAYTHRELPFDQLVTALRPPRAAQQMPLFRTLVVFQNFAQSTLTPSNLSFSPLGRAYTSSRVDLSIFMTQTQQGMEIVWRYSTELFQEHTIQHMADAFQHILEYVVTNPDVQIQDIDFPGHTKGFTHAAKPPTRPTMRTPILKNVKRRAIATSSMEIVKSGPLSPDQRLPLLIQPAHKDVDLVEWAMSNRMALEQQLLTHGGLLFRGFATKTVEQFEAVASAICPNLFAKYGDLPRKGVSEKIYDATPYPADEMIWFHNESSHLHQWPMKQFFCCLQASPEGGETPIVDCRAILQALDPAVLDRFRQKGLLYVRNFHDGFDVSWQDFFRTTDQAQVESMCRQNHMDYDWASGTRLRISQRREALATHPTSDNEVFFNQIQLHHISCVEPATRRSLLTMFEEEALPRNVYYGDGSPIDEATIAHVKETYLKLDVRFLWQDGDVLFLDNMLTAHARAPYHGPRNIAVAMGEMHQSIVF